METITDPALLENRKVSVLDVRPVIDRGDEPFDTIAQHLEDLANDRTLLLVAPFDPRPLKKYVTKQGYQYQYWEPRDDITWTAMHRGGQAERTNLEGPGPSLVVPIPEGSVYVLDCRTLSPPQPLEWTSEVLERLGEEDLVVQHNDRRPALLLDNLDGYDWTISEEDDRVRVEFMAE